MTLLKHRISAHLFQNFREFLVRNFDFDVADRAVPSHLLDQIEIAAADFADSAASPQAIDEAIRLIDRESLLAIKNALEMSYTDGITAITEAYLQPDDSITGKFIDKVNPKITKRLEFKLTDEELSYTLVNDRELANFSEEDWLDFAAATKPKNCKKGIPCGGSCIAASKQCKSSSPAQQTSNKKAVTTAKKATTGKKAAVPATPAPPANPNVKVNQPELDKSRADLIKRFGKKAVEDTEKNVHDILKSDDTQIYIRVGKTDTLDLILGDRFKNSAELGVKDHNIPHLQDDYQTARNRVEEKTLGYSKNTKPEDRPIYGYFGSKDPNQGASHHDVDDVYGSITVKLKPEVKDRATFTGADSFKSGIASDLNKDGTPPPPNAASLVATTRHGYDREDLPSHYPGYFKSKSEDKSQLTAAAKAKNIDDLAEACAPTGNKYVEAQIHGKVTPKDIAEIHFNSKTLYDQPSEAVAKFAKDNGVDLFVNGKKLSNKEIDDVVFAAAHKNKTKEELEEELSAKLDAEDAAKAAAAAKTKKPKKTKPDPDYEWEPLSLPSWYASKKDPLQIKEYEKFWETTLKDPKWQKLKNAPPPPPPGAKELAAISNYTGESYTTINGALRDKDNKNGHSPEEIKQAHEIAEKARKGLKELPDPKGKSYRGATIPQEVIDQYEVGKNITEPAFVSTGKSPSKAWEGNTYFVIIPKKGGGSASAYVDDYSQHQGEKEVLYAPGTNFKCLKKEVGVAYEPKGSLYTYQNRIVLQEV